jgi:hypothetical protein
MMICEFDKVYFFAIPPHPTTTNPDWSMIDYRASTFTTVVTASFCSEL